MYQLLRLEGTGRIQGLVRRFVRFGLVGASGVGINLGVFWLLTERLSLHYLVAASVAIETAMCSNYLLNNNWTFADRRTHVISFTGLARYHAVSFGGMLANLLVLHILVSRADTPAIVGNLAGIALATAWNFVVNVLWTWRSPRQATEASGGHGWRPRPLSSSRPAAGVEKPS